MKKLLALVIALAMVLSLATVLVSAEDEPDAYLVLVNDGSGSAPCINYAYSGDLLNGNYTVDVEALVCFEGCAGDGSVYLNCYPYNGNTLLSWQDYATHKSVEAGVWTKVEKTGWVLSKDGLDPDKISMGLGFWNATGTIKVAYIKVSQNGEVIWSVDYADGLDLAAEDITLLQGITEDNKGTAWYLVGVTEPVEESTPAEPLPENLENIAEGKSYTVADNNPRNDGYDDNETGKLTDGIVGIVNSATDLLGLKATEEAGGVLTTVIDLGEVKDFLAIRAYAVHYDGWGIPAPVKVTFAVSEDGENYSDAIEVPADKAEILAGEGAGEGWEFPAYLAQGEFTGRYVKVCFCRSGAGHVWVSEVQVLAEAAAPVEESSEPAPAESEPATPTTGDAGIIALAVISVIALGGAVIVKKSK